MQMISSGDCRLEGKQLVAQLYMCRPRGVLGCLQVEDIRSQPEMTAVERGRVKSNPCRCLTQEKNESQKQIVSCQVRQCAMK